MLGLKNRPIDVTRLFTNRMSWVRLTSTTNLGLPDNKNSVLYKLNQLFGGTARLEAASLRQNLILQNFPRFIPPNPLTNRPSRLEGFGFNRGESIEGVVGTAWSGGAYGFGGAFDRGYVPPPGITKVSVTHQNRGALAKIDIAITAFSREQFALIDALFMRPGYQSLIEFGWSIYYKQPPPPGFESFKSIGDTSELEYNDSAFGNSISPEGFYEFGSNENTKAFDLINEFSPSATTYDIVEAIKEDRRNYAGNYDGFLGSVNNFKWNLESDGSYSIQIQLTAVGDVIESLKMNVGAGNVELDNDATGEATTVTLEDVEEAGDAAEALSGVAASSALSAINKVKPLVEANRFKSAFNKFLFDLRPLAFDIYQYGQTTGQDNFPDIYTQVAENNDAFRIDPGSVSVKFPLTFKDFPRPYKAINIVAAEIEVFNETTGQIETVTSDSVESKVIVKDRSTPTNFVEGNGAMLLPLINNSTFKSDNINDMYISFASICAFIQNNLVLYDFKNGKKTPIFYFDDSIYHINSFSQLFSNPDGSSEISSGKINGEDVHYKYYHNTTFGSFGAENRWRDKVYMFTFPGQFSARPDICVMPPQNLPGILGADISTIAGGSISDLLRKNQLFSQIYQEGKPAQYLGDLGAVMFNTAYLADKLASLPAQEEVSILDFLQELIDDMTRAFGDVNSISIVVTDEGEINFYEQRPQRFDDGTGADAADDFTTLNIFGVRPGDDLGESASGRLTEDENQSLLTQGLPQGSMVTDFGLNSTIPSSLNTTIAISAQANPNQPSADGTGFAEYNVGLTDSLLTERANNIPLDEGEFSGPLYGAITGSDSTFGLSEEDLKRGIRITKFISENQAFFKMASKFYNNTGILSPDDLSTLEEFNKQYASLIQGELTKAGQIRSNFFLPFDLKITMDGISGIRQRDKFIIEDKALPPSYQTGGVDVIVREVNHNIDSSGWSTELSTISSALRDLLVISAPADITTLAPPPPPPPPPPPTGSSDEGTPDDTDDTEFFVSGDPIVDLFNFIAPFEGYRSNAYWDESQWSIGYGSNKVFTGILPEGITEEIIGQTISKDEYPDLFKASNYKTTGEGDTTNELEAYIASYYIISEIYFPGSRNKIGPDIFDALPSNVQAAIVDFGYNCGTGALLYNSGATNLKEGCRQVVEEGADIFVIVQRLAIGPYGGSGNVYPGNVNRRFDEAELAAGRPVTGRSTALAQLAAGTLELYIDPISLVQYAGS